jgi:hypothetical protein
MKQLGEKCGLGKQISPIGQEANADDMTAGPGNLIVSIVENEKEDWSFGAGRAQFLTREL